MENPFHPRRSLPLTFLKYITVSSFLKTNQWMSFTNLYISDKLDERPLHQYNCFSYLGNI
jgi:hypothetical protein